LFVAEHYTLRMLRRSGFKIRCPKEGSQKGRGCQWITALCLVGLVGSTHAGAHQIEGRIVGVHDGDTITLLDAENRQHKIRLDGIDATELGQPFGRASKQHLAERGRVQQDRPIPARGLPRADRRR
jgi:endonuclease YncB( thermonuclease family)